MFSALVGGYYLLMALIKIVFLLVAIAYFTLAERKIMGAIHRRRGPNIEGFWGVLQPIFDGVKLIFKELIVPTSANKRIFLLAPFIILVISLSSWSLIPFYVYEPLSFSSVESASRGLVSELMPPAPIVTEVALPTEKAPEDNYMTHAPAIVHFPQSTVLNVMDWNLINYWLNIEAVSSSAYGILILLAASSLNVYSIIIAGWASSSKYAFLGALRSASQMVSYEVAFSVIVLSLVTLIGSFDLTSLVWIQVKTVWFVWPLLPIFIIFFISALAETNRAPFDLPEAEAELVAGYNVEYSAIIFAMFFLAEYCNMILMSTFSALAFFGGWSIPAVNLNEAPLLAAFSLAVKSIFFCILFIIVRASFPRYRYDQLMDLGWKILMPLATGFFIFEIGLLWTSQLLPFPFNALPPIWYEEKTLLFNPSENFYFEVLRSNEVSAYLITAGILVCVSLVLSFGHPVHSLLALIASFVQLAILMLYSKIEYLGLVFLIVYVGAVSILFLFILMLFDLSVAFQHRYAISLKKKAFSVFFIVLGLKTYQLFTSKLETFCNFYLHKITALLGQRIFKVSQLDFNEIFPVSLELYKAYGVSFFFIIILLLSAMLGSIIIAMHASSGIFRQYRFYNQLEVFLFDSLVYTTVLALKAFSNFKDLLWRVVETKLQEEPLKSDLQRLNWYSWSLTNVVVVTAVYSLNLLLQANPILEDSVSTLTVKKLL